MNVHETLVADLILNRLSSVFHHLDTFHCGELVNDLWRNVGDDFFDPSVFLVHILEFVNYDRCVDEALSVICHDHINVFEILLSDGLHDGIGVG